MAAYYCPIVATTILPSTTTKKKDAGYLLPCDFVQFTPDLNNNNSSSVQKIHSDDRLIPFQQQKQQQ